MRNPSPARSTLGARGSPRNLNCHQLSRCFNAQASSIINGLIPSVVVDVPSRLGRVGGFALAKCTGTCVVDAVLMDLSGNNVASAPARTFRLSDLITDCGSGPKRPFVKTNNIARNAWRWCGSVSWHSLGIFA